MRQKEKMRDSRLVWTAMILLSLFLVGVPAAQAQMRITEIMYDLEGSDTDAEWVEVYNESDSAVSFEQWVFYEADTNHGLTAVSDTSVPAGAYAVIVDDPSVFQTHWPSFNGILFDSSFSLNNTGEPIALKNAAGNVIDSVVYSSEDGAAGDGNSLNREGDGFVARSPSPGGGTNETTSDTSSTPETSNEETTAENDSGGGSQGREVVCDRTNPHMTLDVATPVLAGIATTIEPRVEACGKGLLRGYYYISTGDGRVYQYENERRVIEHTFHTPGRYVVVFDYYHSMLDDDPYKSISTTIEVDEPTVVIDDVVLDDESVEVTLKNETENRFDLSDWILQSRITSFVIPQRTFILPGGTLTFHSAVTKFTHDELRPLRLYTPAYEQVDRWQERSAESEITTSHTPPPTEAPPAHTPAEEELPADEDEDVPLVGTAQAASSQQISHTQASSIPWVASLLLLLALAGVAVVFIRKKQHQGGVAKQDDEPLMIIER